MKCPFCKHLNDKVIDSRLTEDGNAVWRRRECLKCVKRFTTYEKIKEFPLMVIKKDDRREAFSREKILNGILKACEKRPVSMETINALVDKIEKEIFDASEEEVPSKKIGRIVMRELKNLDKIVYVRFASVYREFKDIDEFAEEIKELSKKKHHGK